MNPGADDANGAPGSGQETDQPIHVLMGQERETPADFVRKVRSKIYRRTTASQFASFSWHLPKVILLEMASILSHLFTAVGGKKDSQP